MKDPRTRQQERVLWVKPAVNATQQAECLFEIERVDVRGIHTLVVCDQNSSGSRQAKIQSHPPRNEAGADPGSMFGLGCRARFLSNW
jgi:hypothetical protein